MGLRDPRNLRGDSHTLGFNQQKSQLSFAETDSSKYGNTDNNTSTWLLIIVIRGEGGAFLLWGLVVPGPDKKDLYTYAYLSHKRFYKLCSSRATEDFRGVESNTNLI